MKRRLEFLEAEGETRVVRARPGPSLSLAQSRQVSRIVARKINATTDWKCSTQSYANTSVDWSGYIWNVNANLTRGDTAVNNFEGNLIIPSGLQLRYQFKYSTDLNNMVRVILFQWLGDTNAVSVVGVLDNANIGTVGAPLTGWRWDNRPNIKILYDKTHQLLAGGYETGTSLVVGQAYIPGKRMVKMHMGATAPNAQHGGVHMIVISDSGAGAHPGFLGYTQMSFKD